MTNKTPWLYFPNGKRYSLDWLTEHASTEQTQLQTVFDSGERVHCLCRSKKGDDPTQFPELYVSHRHDKLSLSRMPNTGKDHAHWCPFHGDHEDGESPALQSIPTGFSLNLDAANALLASLGIAPSKDERKQAHLTMTGVLQRLWRLSGNHRYFPNHERDWNRVRHFLLKVAQESEMNGVPLADRLFVPKAVEQALQTNERHADFWSWYDTLTIQPTPGALGLLIAPIMLDKEAMPDLLAGKKVAEWSLMGLQHIPMRLTLSERAIAQLQKERTKTINWWHDISDQPPTMIGLFLVGRSMREVDGKPKQVLMAYQAAMMPVLDNFLPCYSFDEATWMYQLMEESLPFTRVLGSEPNLPDFWISDKQNKRTLAIIENKESTREQALRQKSDAVIVWRTDMSDAPPKVG